MLLPSETLAILAAFRSSLMSIDPLGSAFTPNRVAIIGDTSFRRSLKIGAVEWKDDVSLTFEQVTVDTYRLRMTWSVSIRSIPATVSSAMFLSTSECGTTEAEIAKTMSNLRNDIERKHILFVKDLLDSVSGHEPVVFDWTK